MLFRKRPVVVEARRIALLDVESIAEWCGGQVKGTKLPAWERCIDIQTLEGEMRAEIGDWVIKGVKGEFYPCKHDIFELTYEPVEEDAGVPKSAIGMNEGDRCNRDGCDGVIEYRGDGDGCSCHISPPCSFCVDGVSFCPDCGWESE